MLLQVSSAIFGALLIYLPLCAASSYSLPDCSKLCDLALSGDSDPTLSYNEQRGPPPSADYKVKPSWLDLSQSTLPLVQKKHVKKLPIGSITKQLATDKCEFDKNYVSERHPNSPESPRSSPLSESLSSSSKPRVRSNRSSLSLSSPRSPTSSPNDSSKFVKIPPLSSSRDSPSLERSRGKRRASVNSNTSGTETSEDSTGEIGNFKPDH